MSKQRLKYGLLGLASLKWNNTSFSFTGSRGSKRIQPRDLHHLQLCWNQNIHYLKFYRFLRGLLGIDSLEMNCGCFGARRWFKGKNDDSQGERGDIGSKNVRLYSYDLLRSATDDFHPSNRIGGGGFGVVYKGTLKNGNQVAIKCLSSESKQGTPEFLTEINMISNTRHPNLVQLLGCCVEGRNRILVYEYLENNSLATALHGSKSKYVILDWPKRIAICMGTASGLAFLHDEAEPHIVHRDVKASNILLDENFLPKIGDFGLAKLFPDNVTHVSTRVAGTLGYLAPEYALLGQLTKKADVYSFGVLILEIVSGRSGSNAAFGEDLLVLVEWTWKMREEGRLLDVIDPELAVYPEDEAVRLIKVALFCTQEAASHRPTMKQVVKMLSSEVSLNDAALTRPGVHRTRMPSSHETSSSSGAITGKQSVVTSLAGLSLTSSSQSVMTAVPR